MCPKYGDAFLIRDPRNKKTVHVDPKVSKIIVNESTGKTEQYVVRDIQL